MTKARGSTESSVGPRAGPGSLAPALIFSGTLGVVLACLAVYKGVQDSDYFWHLATGELIDRIGVVPRADPFSFTWAGQPWNPYSWLSELLLYRLVSAVGDAGALIVFATAPAIICLVMSLTLGWRGVRTLAIALPLTLAGWTLLPYVTLRPQVISWVLMAVLVSILLGIDRRRRWPLLLLPPMIALWANLHGLWVIGVSVIGLYTAFTLLGRTRMASSRGLMVAVAVLSIVAAGLTPAGPLGIAYPLQYLNPDSWALEHIAEWQSPDFHDPTHWSLLILFVALALNRGRATPGWLVVLPVIAVAMSLSSIRNVPILAIWSVPTLAMGLEARLHAHGYHRPLAARTMLVRRLLEVGVAVCVAAVAIIALFPSDLSARISDEIGRRYPVNGVDQLEQLDPETRVLAEYNWGGYVISRLYALGGRVFVDGRDGEMYSSEVLNDYSDLVGAGSNWEQLLDEYAVEAILLRPAAPLVHGLVQAAGWCEVFRDDDQVLLLRQELAAGTCASYEFGSGQHLAPLVDP